MSTIIETLTSSNLKALVMDASGASGADKKRNKLGYHRTSVACVHCRRRKIRCLVAADDSQGRCENCIRLRKECHFHPVDQQPPVEKRSRPGSKLDPSSTDPSTTSSPPPLGSPIDPGEYYPYNMSLGSPHEMPAFSPGAFPGTSMSTFAPETVVAPDTPTLDSPHWEDHSLFDPHMTTTGNPRMANHSSILWSQGGHSVTPVASSSPAHGTAAQPQILNAGHPYRVASDNAVFPIPPTRSMTLSTPMELTPGYPGHFQSVSQDYKRRVTSPGQNMGRIANPAIHNPNPQIQGVHLPVSYGNQPATMNLQSWDPSHGLHEASGVDTGNYPMYSTEHMTVDFNGQHMIPHDSNRSPGYKDL